MNKLRKGVFLALVVVGLFAFSACGKDKSGPLEAVFPEDSSVVVVLDYSNEKQIEQVKKLVKMFPETGWMAIIADEFDNLMKEEGLGEDINYKELLQPMVKAKWKMGIAVLVPEGIDLETPDNEEEDLMGIELYFAAKFEKSEKFEKLVDALLAKGERYSALVVKEDGDEKYWTDEGEKFYAVSSGDLFLITMSEELRDAALDRYKKQEGFAAGLGEENLGYFYMSKVFVSDVYGELLKGFGVGNETSLFGGMGDAYFMVMAEKDGFRGVSETEVFDEKAVEDFVGNLNYKTVLDDKVNGDGVFYYMEIPGLGLLVDSLNYSFLSRSYSEDAADYNDFYFDDSPLRTSVLDSNPVMRNAAPEEVGLDFRGETLQILADFVGVETEDAEKLLDTPFAFAMSDNGTLLPSFSLYWKLDKDAVGAGKKLVEKLNTYSDEVINLFDQSIASYGEGVGALKTGKDVVQGGAINKLYVDWDAFSAEYKAQLPLLIPGFDPDFYKLEFYYGVTGDNVLVFAFQPDFPDKYGKNALSKNADFKEAQKMIGGVEGYSVAYLNMVEAFKLADRYKTYLALAQVGLDADILEQYELIKRFATTMKYFVQVGNFADGKMRSETFLKIEKVK